MIYLDNSATTRPLDEVIELMAAIQREEYGNPSSLHRMGLNAEKRIKAARQQVAAALACNASEVCFTSGGTESDNTAIFGAAKAARPNAKRIISTEIEHPAVLEALKALGERGFTVELVPPEADGRISTERLISMLSEECCLVSVMAVNNETGAVQPIEEISKAVSDFNAKKGSRILMHTDMVQGFCKRTFDISNIDLLSLAGHKIHGPKGTGALYVKKSVHIRPFVYGGGQEGGFRSGTENTAGIAGLGLASEIMSGRQKESEAHLAGLRERMVELFKAELRDIKINGPEDTSEAVREGRLCPSVLNVSFLGTRGEVLLHTLESEGVYVSTGSACSSNHKNAKGSHVLRAMGLNDREVEGALRFSFSPFNTLPEVEEAAEKTVTAVKKFRRLGSFR